MQQHARLARSVELLAELVAFDTTSHLSNRALISFVARYLSEHGIVSTEIVNADGTKANLFATIGPQCDGGVVLSGHTDVVPVTGQRWSQDPFALTAQGDRLVGRGSADMKGYLAVVLAQLEQFLAAPLQRPVHLAFSYDEECGCLGVPGLIDHIREGLPVRPGLVLIGEPTGMVPLAAQKGAHRYRVSVHGKAAHSSAPALGCNAILPAAEMLRVLDGIATELEIEPRDARFDPPHGSINVGRIEGGTAINIIAQDCAFEWEYRFMPAADPDMPARRLSAYANDTLLPALRRRFPEAAIMQEKTFHGPALVPQADCPAEALALQISGANLSGAASFGTEAGFFQEAGLPTIILGPGHIAQAHQPDEYIERAQLALCLQSMDRLTERLCAG